MFRNIFGGGGGNRGPGPQGPQGQGPGSIRDPGGQPNFDGINPRRQSRRDRSEPDGGNWDDGSGNHTQNDRPQSRPRFNDKRRRSQGDDFENPGEFDRGNNNNNSARRNRRGDGDYGPSYTEQEHWNQELARAVRSHGGRSADHLADPRACEEAALPKAQALADAGRGIDHNGASERYQQLVGRAGVRSGGEIVAYAIGTDPADAAEQCAQSWEDSPGHNQHMVADWDLACYAMARSQNGRFYCLGVFANTQNNQFVRR